MAYSLGEIEFDSVTDYNIIFSNTATQKSIEDSEDITDHINKEPVRISFQATITSNTSNIRSKLIEARNEKEVLDFYDGKNLQVVEGVVITDLVLPEQCFENVFVAQVELQQIKLAEKSRMEIVGDDPITSEKVQVEADKVQERSPQEEQVDDGEVPEKSWSSWWYASFEEGDAE